VTTDRSTWRRLPLLSAVPLVALVAAGGLLPARGPSTQTPRQATAVCAQAKAAFTALPAPSTLAAAEAGIADWRRGTFSERIDPSSFSPLPSAIARLETDLKALSAAMSDGDGPGATQALRAARADLARIDSAATQRKVPGCSSLSFGRGYVGQLAALVRSALPLTGDFLTDANAACRRFDTKAVPLQNGLNPKSASSVQSYLRSLHTLYTALQIDLRALTPPAGSEQKFSAFLGSISTGIQELQAAGSALSAGDQTKLRQLGPQLTSLGTTVNREASGLGLTC
jgi:hypothetical protein